MTTILIIVWGAALQTPTELRYTFESEYICLKILERLKQPDALPFVVSARCVTIGQEATSAGQP